MNFQNKTKLLEHLIDTIKMQQDAHIKDRTPFNLFVSGGNTPILLFQELNKQKILDFGVTKIYQVDERYTSKIDKNTNLSNQFVIKQCFQNNINFANNFRCFNLEKNYQDSTADYDSQISNIKPSLTLLGFGIDGHFASVFPNNEGIFESTKSVVGTKASDIYPIKDRMTITPKKILESEKIITVLIGIDKKATFNEFMFGQKNYSEFPAKYFLNRVNFDILTSF